MKPGQHSGEPQTLRHSLDAARAMLARGGVDSPGLSAELLLAKSLGLDRPELLKELLLHPNQKMTEKQAEVFRRDAARRAAGEPIAYISGCKEFYGRGFHVTRDTLIPRPETELLVDAVLASAKKTGGRAIRRFADLGTGSGCIAVTLALELPGTLGLAVDKSPGALTVARENARALGAAGLSFVQTDFERPFLADAALDCVVGNPPYISAEEFQELSREVREFEPASALMPRKDSSFGMEHVAAVVRTAERALAPGGRLFMEIGWRQGAQALALLNAAPWREASVHRDLAGLDRLVVARRA